MAGTAYIAGVYKATPTAAPDGELTEILTDAYGNLRIAQTETSSSASASSATTVFSLDTLYYQSIHLQQTSIGSGNTVTYEGSNDNATWIAVNVDRTESLVSFANAAFAASLSQILSAPLKLRYFRARISTYGSGTVTIYYTLRANPDTQQAQGLRGTFSSAQALSGSVLVEGSAAHDAAVSGNPFRIAARALTTNITAVATGDVVDRVATLVGAAINKPYSIPEADWSYAAATGGILNTTTAVTIKAAVASNRNYITGIDIATDGALGAVTEVAVRDGAGGTVLWRIRIGTAGLQAGRSIVFPTPVKSTANTLLEVVTLTASVTGAVYINAQGYAAP